MNVNLFQRDNLLLEYKKNAQDKMISKIRSPRYTYEIKSTIIIKGSTNKNNTNITINNRNAIT